MHNLTKDGEFRYIVQWFNEWSELQRDDFVPILVDYLTTAAEQGTTDEANGCNALYMNGLVQAVTQSGIHERPMSLFQCRIKLFREWSVKWPQDFKLKLQQKIIEMDTKVGEKIINELKTSNGDDALQSNGVATLHDDSDCDEVTNASAVMRAAQAIVAATEEAIQNDARLIVEPTVATATVTATTTITTSSSSSLVTTNATTTATETILNGTPVAAAAADDDGDDDVDDDDGVEDVDDIVSDNGDLTVSVAALTTTSPILTMRTEPAEPVELPTQEHVATTATTTTTTTLATAIPI